MEAHEWIAMRLCIVTSMILNAANLADVVQDVLFDPNTVEPTSLILTSLAIWSANVLVFCCFTGRSTAAAPTRARVVRTIRPISTFPRTR